MSRNQAPHLTGGFFSRFARHWKGLTLGTIAVTLVTGAVGSVGESIGSKITAWGSGVIGGIANHKTGRSVSAQKTLKLAHLLFDRGRHTEVVSTLKPITDAPDPAPEALMLAARSQTQLENYGEALELLRAIPDESEKAAHLALQAYIYLKWNDTANASALADEAVAKDATSIEARYTRAQIANWDHRYDDAIPDLQFIVQAEPARRKARQDLISLLSRQGHFLEAKRQCVHLMNTNRKDPRFPELCGVIRHRACKFEEAVPLYRRAIDLTATGEDITSLETNIALASERKPPLGSAVRTCAAIQ